MFKTDYASLAASKKTVYEHLRLTPTFQVNDSHQPFAYVDASFKQPTTSQWDIAEAATLRSKAVTTGSSDSFSRVCKNLGLPQELHNLYRTWFIQCGRPVYNGTVTPELVPVTKGSHGQVPKLPAGWRSPYPSGSAWRQLKATQATIQHAECNGPAMLATILREMSGQKH